jgi:type III secretion protein S
MSQDSFLSQMNTALLTVLIASSPALAAAILVGVGVGLLQALTQIQDPTLPQAVKLVVVLVITIVLGPLLAIQIATLSQRLFEQFPALTR